MANITKRRSFTGRQVILSPETSLTRQNIVSVLTKAVTIHEFNRKEIDFLWDYYCGDQPILDRVKPVRPEINNHVVVNRALEIVDFKVGYLLGEPVQYIGTGCNEQISAAIDTLNRWMSSEAKSSIDHDLGEWGAVAGTSYRFVQPDEQGEEDDAPFEIASIDPRDAFVIYTTGPFRSPLAGVVIIRNAIGSVVRYECYTKTKKFILSSRKQLIGEEANTLRAIPLIEYPANNARLGSFEPVVSLLNAINMVESNRVDGVEQFIQSLIKFVNCDITPEDFKELRELGAIKITSTSNLPADIDVLVNELNQDQTQTLVDNLYREVLTICGVPDRSGDTQSSNSASAVILDKGWSLAEARAKESELSFKRSERDFLKLVLRICREKSAFALAVSDIDMKFTRRNYEAIQSKSQVLVMMLAQEKIHPLLAFSSCGLFSDPEGAFAMSMDWYEQQGAQAKDALSINEKSSEDVNPQ